MTIKGKMWRKIKIWSAKPNDGVHKTLHNGKLKGPYLAYIGDKTVYHGLYGFYWRLSKNRGMKVYYSIKWRKPRKGLRTVKKHFEKLQKWYKKGYAAKPIKIVRVKLRVHGKQKAWGLVQRHLHFPEKAWKDYAKGYPYDWNCLDQREHPSHNPKGFKKFCKKVGHKGLKLGDVVYCTKKKHWYIVDIAAL